MGEEVSHEKFLNKLDSLIKNELKSETNYLRLKTLLLFKQTLENFLSTSDQYSKINAFDWRLAYEIALLDLPRNSLIPMREQEEKCHQILSLGQLDHINTQKENVFLLLKSFGSPFSHEARYDENLLAVLSTMGPVYRSELGLLGLKQKLNGVFRSSKVTLISEDNWHLEDPNWQTIFSSMSENKKEGMAPRQEFKVKRQEENDLLAFEKNLSASKLQDYINCPKLFYFKNLHLDLPFIEVEDDLLAHELGRLEHKVIESYFENQLSEHFDEDKLNGIVENEFKKYSLKNSKRLSSYQREKALSEVREFSQRGILFLIDFIKVNKAQSIQFEVKKEIQRDFDFKGFIDCEIQLEQGKVLLDFKRGSASVASKVDFLDLRKIQLWVYRHFYQEEVSSVGYVCLSELEKSALFSSLPVESSFEVSQTTGLVWEDLDEKYLCFEQQTMDKIRSKNFSPEPLNPFVCDYCQLNSVCDRRSLNV
jgi:hypothetical protein